MSSVISLIVAAIVLVFFEVILPGGILGTIAVLCVLLATWITAAQFGIGAAVLTFLGASIAISLLVFVEFKVLARTSLGRGFFLKAKVTGRSNQAPGSANIVGREGLALTRLNPSGIVKIDGQSHQAQSLDGYVDSGDSIRVSSQDNFKLIIQKL
jgi:membrane-bound ClpP family serine protease